MNEIEEFLKRAAAMRARQQGASPPQGQPAPQAPPPQRVASLVSLHRPLQTEIVEEAEVIEAEPVSGDDVAQHVARHLDSSVFAQRSSYLGESVKSADEAIEAHLHETFEHRLGQLGGRTERAEDSSLDDDENAARAAAQRLLAPEDFKNMLRSPQSLRNAIILSEILNPPYDRW